VDAAIKGRVLIVDDDEAIRETLRFVLEDDGYFVLEAADGLAALDILRTSPHPLIVLTNYNMPRLDGPGLLSFVLSDPELAARHTFVHMTAGNRILPPPFLDVLNRLSVPVLRKPFDIDALLDIVADAEQRLSGTH
jgi:CheY-like chemotaxis protein